MTGRRDGWAALRDLTPARVALGRAGASLPTREVLALALDHARARDAVHLPFDADGVASEIRALGHETVIVASQAADRAAYLRRPDLGRRLDAASRAALAATPCVENVLIVVADGLSSAAIHAHAAPLIAELAPRITAAAWNLGPVVLAHQARVAIGDEIGALLGSRLVILLVGERPGLFFATDSLGAYLTFQPRLGRTDAERNCVSNIRPAGLGYAAAALTIAWLAGEALRRGLTGVALKDESPPPPARLGSVSV